MDQAPVRGPVPGDDAMMAHDKKELARRKDKEEAEANSKVAHAHQLHGRESGGVHEKTGASHGAKGGKGGHKDHKKEERSKLPGDIASQFKGVDLSNVVV